MSGMPVIIAVSVFILTYVLIIGEVLERTVVALVGAGLVIGLHILTQEEALAVVDFNTIGLLVGMMIIVAITKRTGLFQYLAIMAAKWAKGEPWRIVLALSFITAVASAFLDNVTTVLLVAPVTLVITDMLGLNPIPFLLPEVLASNIGGTATLIGDPPNIMIGSATGLGFVDFIVNLGPVIVLVFIAAIMMIKLFYGKQLHVSADRRERLLALDETKAISDHQLLQRSLAVLALVIAGFSFHEQLGLDTASVALMGATLLFVLSRQPVDDIIREVEWPTLFFFLGLFIIVGGLEQVGVIRLMAEWVVGLTGGNLALTALIVLWVSAIASAFIDNIPFVATMIPLIKGIGAMSTINIVPLWWALSLGACLGGNGTLVGASANVVVAGMLQKTEHKLTFGEFLRVGFPVMIVSVAIASVYLWLVYLR